MVEIYSYDIATHERYAYDQQQVEAFRKQYHMGPSGAQGVAIQTKILDFVPKHPAIVLLMQTYQRKIWANFVIPKNYHLQRFASSYVAPSLGGKERQEADVQRLEAFLKRKTRGRFDRKKREEEQEKRQEQGSPDEEAMQEGEVLIHLLEKEVKETNEMVDYVVARMHQFVQA